MFTAEASVSSSERGSWAASSSMKRSFLGFSITSIGVAFRPASGRSLIRPLACSSSSARPPLVGSFGSAMRAPSFNSASDLIFLL
ncbi:hypothetical protein D3C75_1247870 [compost metagenome]